jgi:hypothetical protein
MYNWPTTANLIQKLKTMEEKLQAVKHAEATHPIVHEKLLKMLHAFLDFKRLEGSPVERELYADMDEQNFLERLLICRPLSFFDSSDHWLLKNGERGQGGYDKVGTAEETAPLLLKDLLSYDEIQLAALLAMFVPTHFINSGGRFNQAQPQLRGRTSQFTTKGVYVGVVGARLEKKGCMEWRHCVISKEQNTPANGYGPYETQQGGAGGHDKTSKSGSSSGKAKDNSAEHRLALSDDPPATAAADQDAKLLRVWANFCYYDALEHSQQAASPEGDENSGQQQQR